ncbi:MAG: DUF4143 domain-containing protein [Holosporales bacterium]|jgi:predicted AAA+ superfamily ATPase|nr:DUF4143 domain-containing protein [Holosporales bacterium]
MNELQNTEGTFIRDANLENFLRFGAYPCIYGMTEQNQKIELECLVNDYLYKDILAFENIKHSSQISELLQCLAFRIGSLVSFNELSNNLSISKNTVKKYIDLLEKCYVIFTLPAFSGNLSNEIGKDRKRKIFFYDVGIRNALIGNYQFMKFRTDAGGIWENFCISELIKKAQEEQRRPRQYFWRNYEGKEVDFIEEEDGELTAYKFKYSQDKKAILPKDFEKTYNVKSFHVVTNKNWIEYF